MKNFKVTLFGILTFLVLNVALAGSWQANPFPSAYGGYNALVEYIDDYGNVIDTRNGGHFQKKKDARKAAKALAKELNEGSGFMDNPACDDPLFLC